MNQTTMLAADHLLLAGWVVIGTLRAGPVAARTLLAPQCRAGSIPGLENRAMRRRIQFLRHLSGVLLLGIVAGLLGCQNPAWKNPYAAFGPLTIPAPSQAQVPAGGYYQPPPATATLTPAASTTPANSSSGPNTSTIDIARVPTAMPSNEPPIRIVEPGLPVPAGGSTSPSPASSPIREPQPSPARTPWGSSNPAASPANRPESTVPTIRRDSMVTPATYAQPAFREATVAPAGGAWQAR
jgi:hypothetical protein